MTTTQTANDTTADQIAKVAAVAASWWAKAMERPKFDALGKERDHNMEFAQVMMSMIAAKNPTSDAQLKEFREILASRLRHELAKPFAHHGIIVSVDYHPDEILSSAAMAAGITNECAFPIKTTMWVYRDSVTVRHGYGAPQQTLFGGDKI